MCFTIPSKIVKINKNKAKVEQGSKIREVDISLLPNLQAGDYILEQAGFAIQKIPKKEALEILKTFNQNSYDK